LLADGSEPGPEANLAAGRVVKRIYVGDRIQLDVAVGDLTLSVEGPAAGPRPEPGSPVRLAWPVADTLLFDAA
jgi:hypothetical protein